MFDTALATPPAALSKEDEALLSTLPVLPVPPSGVPPWPAEVTGTRLLVAKDGVFLDARSAVLRILLKIGDYGHPLAPPQVPYGEVGVDQQSIEWLVQQPPHGLLLHAFIAQARREWPHETAAWMIYNRISGTWRLQPAQLDRAGVGHLRYLPPRLLQGDAVACDIHSHGELPAFFSATDDEDDRSDSGAVKLSVVYGQVRGSIVQARIRPVAGGVIGISTEWNLKVAHVPPAPTEHLVEPEVLPPAGMCAQDHALPGEAGPPAVPPWVAAGPA